MIVPEMKIKSDSKEKIISGFLYITLFIPPISFFLILFVYFFFGKKSKYMKFHAGEAGLLWILRVALGFIVLFMEPIYSSSTGLFYLSGNPIIWILSAVLNVLTIIMIIAAFAGRSFKLSGIFDFLKK